MAINARTKGATGEREFCSWLHARLCLEEMPLRNLEQVRSGGADVIEIPELPGVMFEVKRCESLSLLKWWHQVRRACSEEHHIPIVVFRQNRKDWEFLISSEIIGVPNGYIRMSHIVWLKWIKKEFSL